MSKNTRKFETKQLLVLRRKSALCCAVEFWQKCELLLMFRGQMGLKSACQ
jgi:hypothetical protein